MIIEIKKALFNLKRVLFPKNYLQKLKLRGLKVGENVNIQKGVIIDDSHCWHITIGDNVTLAPYVHILAHDASTKHFLGYTKIGKVNIGNKVFIGASSMILPGVIIGDNVVIGAGSIVNIDIPSNSVAVGNPVKVIGSINDFISKKEYELQKFPVFDESYTLNSGLNEKKCDEMNQAMVDRFGYII